MSYLLIQSALSAATQEASANPAPTTAFALALIMLVAIPVSLILSGVVLWLVSLMAVFLCEPAAKMRLREINELWIICVCSKFLVFLVSFVIWTAIVGIGLSWDLL